MASSTTKHRHACPTCRDILGVTGCRFDRHEFYCHRCNRGFDASDGDPLPEAVADMPATRTPVYLRIRAIAPARYSEICDGVPYGATAVEDSLADLTGAGVVERQTDPDDNRRTLYEAVE